MLIIFRATIFRPSYQNFIYKLLFQVNKSDREDTFKKTPNIPRTPQVAPKTPSSAVPTPQRSILKDMSTHSVTKKRRVVFATQGEEDMMSNSGESCTFELMELEVFATDP